ncbi:MAG: SMI1/KNR4 family protein [Gemmataceae bacterium]
MTETTKLFPWEPTFRRIRALYRPEFHYPPRPTSADLDTAEEALKCPLPRSYRAFAEEFGLGGYLMNLPQILPLTRPIWAKKSDWSSSVLDATRFFRTYDWEEDAENPEMPAATFFRRVVVFAIDTSYHYWIFDPLAVTNPRLREYRIFDVGRFWDTTPIADSFDKWLLWIDKHYGFDDEVESTPQNPEFQPIFKPNSNDPNAMTFYRDTTRKRKRKKKPNPKHLDHWLSWNKGTVRNLARAIREDHRIDSFPILADALEEAGCDHEDLLNFCRSGDPDIDGQWVLQVLLGKPPKTT